MSSSRIPVPGVSRIPQPSSRRQSVRAPRRSSLGPATGHRPGESRLGAAPLDRGNVLPVPDPPRAKRAARPSSLTTKPAYDPTATVRAKSEKLARQKQAREDRMAAKKLAEAQEAEARRKKAEALANERQDRLVGAKAGPKAPRTARRSTLGGRTAAPSKVDTAAAGGPEGFTAPTKQSAPKNSPAAKKPRVDPKEHARKKQEALAQAKKLREERMAESKRRAAERKAEKEREEAARLERLQSGGNPFGAMPAPSQTETHTAPEADRSDTVQAAPCVEETAKRKEDGAPQEQNERLKRQKQAQLEARMANPSCLRNSSCRCKDCASFNPTPEITTENLPTKLQLNEPECLRTTSCTCPECAREPATVAATSAPPASPTPDRGQCLRTSDCRCDECAALTVKLPDKQTAATVPVVDAAVVYDEPESTCQRSLSCGCPECANIRNLKLLASTPAKASNPTQKDDTSETESGAGSSCLRSSDCRCKACKLAKTSPVAKGLGAKLHDSLAAPQSDAQQQEPQFCPDLALDAGSRIDAQDGTGGWYEAFIVDTRADDVQVHYIGWPYTWDEWLPRDSIRLQHLHAYTDPNGTSVGPDGQEVVPTRRTNSGTETPIKSRQEEAETQATRDQKDEDAPAVSKGLKQNRLAVQDFLASCGMNIRSYASKLAAHGFDDLSCLECAQLADLTDAGVLVGHARKILAAVATEHVGSVASPAQRALEAGWNSSTTPDKTDIDDEGMPIETVKVPDKMVSDVTSTPSTEQRRVRRGNFLLERTASSAEKFMCHGLNGSAVEAATTAHDELVSATTASADSPATVHHNENDNHASASPPLPAAAPKLANVSVADDELPGHAEEEAAVEITLIACSGCSRKFSQKALAKHENICKQVFGTKRKAFSASGQRAAAIAAANGTDNAAPLRKSKRARQQEKEEKARKDAEAKKIKEQASARWKAESAQFREAMRNNRLIAQAQKEGKPLSEVDFS